MNTILVVDDEPNYLIVLSELLKEEGFEIMTAQRGEDGLKIVMDTDLDLVITDMRMPGMDGLELLQAVKSYNKDLPVIMITAFGEVEKAVVAMRAGAYNYLVKPFNNEELLLNIGKAIEHYSLLRENLRLRDEARVRYGFASIVGKNERMQEIYRLIEKVAPTPTSVLITGESGTGKELVARAIHYTSLRADKPFIPIDCTTIPSELMESELFGYEKGAFTCANERKVGLIEMAQGGTTFFDEIGDLDFALQKKLLRFLQEKEIRRISGKEKIKVDVRVLSATNRNIEKALQNDEFRPDLYYRLNVITIRIPPLRKRMDDIPLLANHCLEHFREKNKKDIREIEQQALAALMSYDWPGNVRELENVMERAVILCPHDTINVECLPKKMQMLAGEEYPVVKEFNLPEIEKRTIIKALDKASWNQSRAAGLLGISRKQLRTKMKNLELLPAAEK